MTIAVVTVGAVLALGGCGGGPDEVNGGMIGTATPAPGSAAPATTTAPSTTAPSTTTARDTQAGGSSGGSSGGEASTTRCTDRTNYAGDTRSNAEINSLGERTGTCPPVRTAPPAAAGVPYDPQVSCTNKVNYAGDPRSNAEINSIGQRTGTCPAVQR